MSWRVVLTKQAQKDTKKLSASDLKQKAEALINILHENPYQVPPPYEKLNNPRLIDESCLVMLIQSVSYQ